MNGEHQLLVYADDVNMLGEKLQTTRENREIFIKASKDINLEVNFKNTKYMIIRHNKNIGQNQNILIENLSCENVEKFKYQGVMVTNANNIHKEIKDRINMGNACYSFEKILSSCLLSKKLKVNIYKTIMSHIVWL